MSTATTPAFRAYRARQQQQRRRQVADGTWNPWGNTAEVLAHIHDLMAAHWAPTGIARAAGVSDLIVLGLLHNRRRRITSANAAKVLAVRPRERIGWVPVDGPERRLRALAMAGLGLDAVAAETGLGHETLGRIRRGARRLAHPHTARIIADAYPRLLEMAAEAGTDRIRASAAAKGWHDHAAWTRYTIDDPGARPLKKEN